MSYYYDKDVSIQDREKNFYKKPNDLESLELDLSKIKDFQFLELVDTEYGLKELSEAKKSGLLYGKPGKVKPYYKDIYFLGFIVIAIVFFLMMFTSFAKPVNLTNLKNENSQKVPYYKDLEPPEIRVVDTESAEEKINRLFPVNELTE